MTIAATIERLTKELEPYHAQLVGVSKTQTVELIKEAYNAGLRHFGENRVQELVSKAPALPDDIQWHLIGHLQTNKVKQAVPYSSMIESVDSLKVLQEINKQAAGAEKKLPVLLQIHIAHEETKYGFSPEELVQFLAEFTPDIYNNVSIAGLMGIATNTSDTAVIRNEFKGLRQLFDQVKTEHFKNDPAFKEVSMGMSSDYKIALEEGSTIVRIGSALFGAR